MVELPSDVTIVSPRQSPRVRRHDSAVRDAIGDAIHDCGGPVTLDFLSNSPFQQSGNPDWSGAFDSQSELLNPLSFCDGEQNLANSGFWETLLDKSTATFSPGRPSSSQTPPGGDIQATHTDNSTLSELNQDPDFSLFLNSPDRLSIDPSSFHTESHHRRSVGRISTSSPHLTDDDKIQKDNIELELVSRTASTAEQEADQVATRDDKLAESITSLHHSLKYLVIPPFDIASQRYEYGDSILSDLFSPQFCE